MKVAQSTMQVTVQCAVPREQAVHQIYQILLSSTPLKKLSFLPSS